MAVRLVEPGCSIKEGSWGDFRADIIKVAPELSQIIDELSPNKKYKLVEADYTFGERITEVGHLCIPDKHGHLARLDTNEVSSAIKNELSYSATPLMLQLAKGSEASIEAGERIIPLHLFTPGDLFGLSAAVMPLMNHSLWTITAGARSLFFAPKVSDALGHQRLRNAYGVSEKAPKNLSEQWYTFKQISHQTNLRRPWLSKVIIFAKEWFEHKNDSIEWLKFQKYLLLKNWIQSRRSRLKEDVSLLWEAFAALVRKRNLKPSPYMMDTVMHLLFLATGSIPGFRPADGSELLAPTDILEHAYTSVYGLKEHAPIILQPYVFDRELPQHSVYYSLSHPTLLDGSPTIRYASSLIAEIRELKLLMDIMVEVLETTGHTANLLLNHINFDFFHSGEDKLQEIDNTKSLILSDPELQRYLQRYEGKTFAHQGPFFRGVVRINSG